MTVANVVEKTWLTRYPRPDVCTMNRGSEFIGHAFKKELMENKYGVVMKFATTTNPQANSVIECIHQVLGNMLRTFTLETNYLDTDDTWAGILAATAFAIRNTYHTTLKATPGQLVFGRDLIFNTKYIADWEEIRQRKESTIQYNDKRENSKHIQYKYTVLHTRY